MKRLLKYVLVGLLAVGIVMPCMSVEVKAAVAPNLERPFDIPNQEEVMQLPGGLSDDIVKVPAIGNIGGIDYPINFVGRPVNGVPTVDTIQLTQPGSTTFTNNINITNLHVLTADSVSAAPGVIVNVDT